VFTGIIEELGTVRGIDRGPRSARLTVAGPVVLADVKIGDSVAVNGACLTVVGFDRESFRAEVMAETLARTNLGELRPGDRVNLERAARLGDRLGGHLVSGHIDGVGTIKSRQEVDIAIRLEVTAPETVLKYLVPKGSVAIDGISLTVIDVDSRGFSVSLIPHTAGMTTLGLKQTGSRVNLETDIIGKYVERLLAPSWLGDGGETAGKAAGEGVSVDFLAEHGFV
jgi:riboflavin synthase